VSSPRTLVTSFLVACLAVGAVGALGAPASGADDDPSGTVARIEAHVEAGIRANRIPGGALAVVDEHGEVHLRGFGRTGRAGETVTPDTPFIIGSVTKSMTALAVMQLAEDGAIDLDAPVSRYLAWFEVQPSSWSQRVTVRTLLEHTSGLPALAGAPATTWMADRPIGDTAAAVRGSQLADEPGTSWVYANANYVLLGAIIEEVTGRPYADQLEQRVFAPLGMTRSTARLDEGRALGLGDGHRFVFGVPVAHTSHREGLVPSGLVVSTAHDLGRYLQALLGGGELDGERILSAAGVEAMFTPAADATVGPWAKAPDATYGLGWFVGSAPFGTTSVVFHPGASPDFGAMAAVVPSAGTALAVVVNVGPRVAVPGAAGDIDRIGAGAVSLLTGSEPAEAGTVQDAYRVVTPMLVLVLLLALWLAVRRPPAHRGRRHHLVVAVLTATCALLLLALPTLGVGWRQSWLWSPDLTFTALLTAGAFAVAAVRRLLTLRGRRPTAAPSAVGDPPVPMLTRR
jgi:CubicO group peptidase (beta-lactamase class C family)